MFYKNIFLFFLLMIIHQLIHAFDSIDKLSNTELIELILTPTPRIEISSEQLSDLSNELVSAIDERQYNTVLEAAKRKCEPLASEINRINLDNAKKFKMIVLALIAADLPQSGPNPLIDADYFNSKSPVEKLFRDILTLFKITIVDQLITDDQTNVKLSNYRLYFSPSIASRWSISIEKDQNSPHNDDYPYTEKDLQRASHSIFSYLIPNSDPNFPSLFQQFNSVLAKTILLSLPLNFPMAASLQTLSIPSFSLFDLVQESYLEELLSFAINTSDSHKDLAEQIYQAPINNNKLKTLLLATLLLKDEEKNPFFNISYFNEEISRLIQCSLLCFGIKLEITHTPPSENLLLIASNHDISLFLEQNEKGYFRLILHGKNPFQPFKHNQTAVFMASDKEDLAYIVNAYRILLPSTLKNHGMMNFPSLFYENQNLMLESKKIWDLLFKQAKHKRYKELLNETSYALQEIDIRAFKKLLKHELKKIDPLKNFYTKARELNEELVTKIESSITLSDSEKPFFYWLISLNFLDLTPLKGETKYENPLHYATGLMSFTHPIVISFASLLSFIENPETLLNDINDKTRSATEKNRKSRGGILNVRNNLKDFIFHAAMKEYPSLLAQRIHQGPEVVLNHIILKLDQIMREHGSPYKIHASNNKILLINSADNRALTSHYKSQKHALEDSNNELLLRGEECMKAWKNNINLERYEEARALAVNFFNASKDGHVRNPAILEAINQIHALPEHEVSKAEKIIFYALVTNSYGWKSKLALLPANEFFSGWWSRLNQPTVQHSLTILHLLSQKMKTIIEPNLKKMNLKTKEFKVNWKKSINNICQSAFIDNFNTEIDLLNNINFFFKNSLQDPQALKNLRPEK